MVKVLQFSLTSLLLATACGPQSQSIQPHTSSSKALVSVEQAVEAFQLVTQIDYLPFAYVEDGCYARELYMAAELASSAIPSSAHYIWGDLHPNPETQWIYHVAPLIKVDEQEPWILDPSLEKKPLRVSKWIHKNFPAGEYTTEITAGSAYFDESGRTKEFNNDRMIRNFAEMPSFLTGDLISACSVMHNYLGREGLDPQGKRARLLSRTSELVRELHAADKLEVNIGDSEASLGHIKRCEEAVQKGLDPLVL